MARQRPEGGQGISPRRERGRHSTQRRGPGGSQEGRSQGLIWRLLGKPLGDFSPPGHTLRSAPRHPVSPLPVHAPSTLQLESSS